MIIRIKLFRWRFRSIVAVVRVLVELIFFRHIVFDFVSTLSWCHVKFPIFLHDFFSLSFFFVVWFYNLKKWNRAKKWENIEQSYRVTVNSLNQIRKYRVMGCFTNIKIYYGVVVDNSFIQLLIKWDLTSIYWMRLMKWHCMKFDAQLLNTISIANIKRSDSLFLTHTYKHTRTNTIVRVKHETEENNSFILMTFQWYGKKLFNFQVFFSNQQDVILDESFTRK